MLVLMRLATEGVINWYPGHIARAERELQSYLKRVDVVLEARDARIARTTAHPDVRKWVGPRPCATVFTFTDAMPSAALQEFPENAFFVDAKRGGGDLPKVREFMRAAGRKVNEKREARGIRPRPARCAVIGFPNVGKSALINRLAGRNAVKSENRAGVTRQLNWVRGQDYELLDSPGIIPAKQGDQLSAARLAICGDIGDASYDNRYVCASLVDHLLNLPPGYAPEAIGRLIKRTGLDPRTYDTAQHFLEDVAASKFQDDQQNAATALLADFRNGRLGKIALEQPFLIDSSSSKEEEEVIPKDAPEILLRQHDDDVQAFLDDPVWHRRLVDSDFDGW